MRDFLPFGLEDALSWRESHKTPFYIYDEMGIRETCQAVQEAFSWNEGFTEHYAVKACPTPGILRVLKEEGFGTDCASAPEIELSLRSGISGEKIMFTSNETTAEEYEIAMNAGAIINLDDRTQADILLSTGRVPEVICCRYNPGSFEMASDIMGHLYDSKYGMTKEQMIETFELMASKGTKRFGIHAMLMSNCLAEIYYPRLAALLFELAVEIREKTGISVEFLDFAGGVGIPYRPEEKAVDIRKVGEAVKKVYEEIVTANGMAIAIHTEMGRFITGPHGYLVTSVVGHKHIYKEYVGVDATAANLMRPAMYGAYHHVTVLGKENAVKDTVVDVVGSLCENNDKFAIDRELPKTEIGDILVIADAGAHGHSMGYNYNGRLRSAEFLMHEDKSITMIRRAETMADYFSTLDIDPAFQ